MGTDDTGLFRAPADVLLAGEGRAGCVYALGVRCKVKMQPRSYSTSSSYDVHPPQQKRPLSLKGFWKVSEKRDIIPSINPGPSSSFIKRLPYTCLRACAMSIRSDCNPHSLHSTGPAGR